MARYPDARRVTSGFARRVKAARVLGGYTQENFSRLLGIKRDRYAKYELGQAEPPFHILTTISQFTHQSLDTLIGGRAALGHEAMNIVGSPLADIKAVGNVEKAWWWKTDKQHRVMNVWHLHNYIPQEGRLPSVLGRTRWDTAGGDPKTDKIWKEHLEDLDSHRPFENFRYPSKSRDGLPAEICVSGRPVFDEKRKFQGYSGFAYSIAVSARGAQSADA